MTTTTIPFVAFDKIPRLRRGIVISEKIDGTNAQVHITEDGQVLAGSRNRWITPEDDNMGFARWVKEHEEELRTGLGIGTHFGEWWGSGIQRRYGMTEKAFSLFNSGRWNQNTPPPACCRVVPVLGGGPMTDEFINACLDDLRTNGSKAAPGFMQPEGIVIFFPAASALYKVLLVGDELPKSMAVAS